MKLNRTFIILFLSIFLYSCEKENPQTLEQKEILYNVLERGNFKVEDDNTINEQP